jgi:hypothetical protein
MEREKMKYLKIKPIGRKFSFCPTDIIPIIKRTWADSLGDQVKGKQSIVNCG